jgi:hypothetical protein
MRIVQLLVIGLPVAGLLVITPAMSVSFDGASLRALNNADRVVQEAGYRAYYHGYRYGARRCQNSPAEC